MCYRTEKAEMKSLKDGVGDGIDQREVWMRKTLLKCVYWLGKMKRQSGLVEQNVVLFG